MGAVKGDPASVTSGYNPILIATTIQQLPLPLNVSAWLKAEMEHQLFCKSVSPSGPSGMFEICTSSTTQKQAK